MRPQYHRMRYDYNEIGQLISAVNPNSRTNLAYDESGRLIQETLISHLAQDGQYQAREHTLTHDYDELGNRIATTLPDGKVINQLHYGSGHLYNQSLHDPSTDEYIELRHSERNKLHQEIRRQQGSLTSSYNYDPVGRLIKQYSSSDNHITIQRDYNYDALGQLTHLSGHSVLGSNKRTEQNTAIQNQQSQFTRNHQYQYDTQGRLIEHKLTDYQNHTGITEVFAFDPASNRVPVRVADDTTDKTQINHGRPRELIQNNQRIKYTYDSHGRVLYKTTEHTDESNAKQQRQALQLQYNANNELEKSLRTQYQGNQVIKTQTEYHYDAFGRRIHKHSETRRLTQSKDQLRQTNKTQHQHTHMLWDSDLPIQEYSDTHVYTTIYDQGSFKPIARLIWLREDIPQPINDESIIKQDNPHIKVEVQPKSKIEVYHYHNDQLGTPNELTNDKGEVVWLADYEAWGNTAKVIYSPVKINQMQVSQDELQPIRFQGQHFDQETGLHYNRFRYYDPDMGMFTTRDPIGLRGGDNVFAYAPNPTGWIDPLGLRFTGYTMADARQNLRNGSNPKIKPISPEKQGAGWVVPAKYSKSDVFDEWLRMEASFAKGKMTPCPTKEPTACTSCTKKDEWRKYGGVPSKFHCGFDGYLENRVPTDANPAPTNECFYDNSGKLVIESHDYGGCRGTPDYFPYYGGEVKGDLGRVYDHMKNDSGGPPGPSRNFENIGDEAKAATKKYYDDHPKERQAERAKQTTDIKQDDNWN